MSTVKWLLLVLIMGLWLSAVVVSIRASITSGRVDSWLHRAQAAGNPQQVAEFLGEYKLALGRTGRTEGYSCIFHFPGCYMPTYLRAVDGLIQRANDLARQSPTEASYQMGLLNLEKDLGDIETTAFGVWTASFWGIYKLLFAIVGWAFAILVAYLLEQETAR